MPLIACDCIPHQKSLLEQVRFGQQALLVEEQKRQAMLGEREAEQRQATQLRAQLDDLQQQLEAARAAHAAELAAVEIKLSTERADSQRSAIGAAAAQAAQLRAAAEMAAAQASERAARKELESAAEARKTAVERALSEAKREAAEAAASAVRKAVSDAEVLTQAAVARP